MTQSTCKRWFALVCLLLFAAVSYAQDPTITENSTNLFIDATSGSDSYNCLYGDFQSGTDGPCATIGKAESTTSGTTTGVYFLEGTEPNDEIYNLPSSHGGTVGSKLVIGAYYMDAGTPKRRLTASRGNMPFFNQGVIEPERSYFTSYAGTGDDHPSTSRNYTVTQFAAIINGDNTDNIRLENLRIGNSEGECIQFNTNDQVDNPTNFANKHGGIEIYNIHCSHVANNGIQFQFYDDITIEHSVIADTSRKDFALGASAAAISCQGSEAVVIKDNDIIGTLGEAIGCFAAMSDFFISGNYVYGASAVSIYSNGTHTGLIHGNLSVEAPAGELSGWNSTWTKDSLAESYSGAFGGEVIAAFESQTLAASWVATTDRPHNIAWAFNISISLSDGLKMGPDSLDTAVSDYSDLYWYNNFLIANNSQVERVSSGFYSYSSNRMYNNILWKAGEAVSVVQGTTSGMAFENNWFDGSVPSGWEDDTAGDGGDETTNLNVTKTSGFRNLTLNTISSADSDQIDWGDIRVSTELLNLNDIKPSASSNTVGQGTAESSLTLPSGITVAILSDLRQDFEGNSLNDPVDIGPFTDSPAGGGGGGGGGNQTIEYVCSEQTEHSSATVNWDTNICTGAQSGDLAVFLFTEQSGTAGFNTLENGTQIGSAQTSQGDNSSVLAWYELTGTDISNDFVSFDSFWSASTTGASVIAVFRNQDTTSPIDTNNQAGGTITAANNIIGPSITPSADDRMVVQFAACDVDSGTYAAAPAGTPTGTERFDGQDTFNRQWAYVQSYLQTTAAAISLEADIDQTDAYAYWQIAIKPAAVPGSPLLLRVRNQ